jgi:hypothetical protein
MKAHASTFVAGGPCVQQCVADVLDGLGQRAAAQARGLGLMHRAATRKTRPEQHKDRQAGKGAAVQQTTSSISSPILDSTASSLSTSIPTWISRHTCRTCTAACACAVSCGKTLCWSAGRAKTLVLLLVQMACLLPSQGPADMISEQKATANRPRVEECIIAMVVYGCLQKRASIDRYHTCLQ